MSSMHKGRGEQPVTPKPGFPDAKSLEQATRIIAALDIARRFGGIDGEHHKNWVIDQMVRALTGEGYQRWVALTRSGPDGPATYDWHEGIAP